LQVSEVDTAEPTVIFGARPCDVTGLAFLDRAFRLGGIEDPYWVRRRDQTTVVSLVCPHPAPGCFGPSTGVNETSPEGADVVLTDIGNAYVVEVKSEKGQAAVDPAGDAFGPAAEEDLIAAREAGETLLEELAEQAIDLDEPEARAKAFLQSPAWEQVWNRCLSCGICAFLCPTCHCFDICDQSCRGGGERIRCYDTCSSKLYTKQAGGHNSRPTAKERLTQRVMHKFSYGPERLGLIGCVGCGRCRRCPVDIDLQMELSAVRSEK
jgi:ferredoxin